MTDLVYLNGAIVPRNEAHISVMDYGFLYGFGLFETMRAYGGRVFLLDRHLARLAHSAKMLGIPVEGLDLEEAVTRTIEANHLGDARVRITLSRGEGGVVPDPGTCGKPTVLVVAQSYHPYSEQVYEKGFGAIVSSLRRNSQSPVSRMKATNYLESMLARQEARNAGVDEALCLNEKGYLAEASMSNLFLVANNVLKTPALDCGILPGVTREVVLELATQLGIKTLETDISLDEFLHAEEAFMTNSLIEIMPLVEVDGKTIGAGRLGPLTGRLRKAYLELVFSSTSA